MSWGILILVGLVILVIPPLRTLAGLMISYLVTPSVVAILGTTAKWILYLGKTIMLWHRVLLKNLLKPRKVIYKSLEDPPDE